MSKITKKENYRVVVEPDIRHHRFVNWNENTKENDAIEICKDLEGQIRRHCEDFISINIEFDNNSYCEFCGDVWTEDGDCNCGCCDKDIEYGKSIGYFDEET